MKKMTSYTYDRTDRILTAGSVSDTVNANGNLAARGEDRFASDRANRLIGATVGGTTTTATYDGDGKRASTTVGGMTTTSMYDVNTSLPVVLNDGRFTYFYGLGLAYAVEQSSGLVRIFHTDGLGSVRAITNLDDQISVIQTYQSDAFGNPTQAQGGVSQPFQFTGQQRDAVSGLYYLRARMYDAQTGRLFQRDPVIGLMTQPSSLDRYVYALGNPCKYTDPSGLHTCGIFGGTSVSVPVMAGASFGIVLDDQGNYALMPSFLVGGSTSVGVSLSAVVQITNLPVVGSLGGPFVNVGVSAGEFLGFTGDVIFGTNGPIGVQIGAGVTWQSPLPLELHGNVNTTPAVWPLTTLEYELIKYALGPGVAAVLDECEQFLSSLKYISSHQPSK